MKTPEDMPNEEILRTFRRRMVADLRGGTPQAPALLYSLARQLGIPDDIVTRDGQVLCQAGRLEAVIMAHLHGTAARIPPPPPTPNAALNAILAEMHRYYCDGEAAQNRLAELRNAHRELFAEWDRYYS